MQGGVVGLIRKKFFPSETKDIVTEKKVVAYSSGTYSPIFSYSYNGEKNLGEMGPIKDYKMDYPALRVRSWQSFVESEITQTVIKRYITWVIGKGLKLQAEPVQKVLEMEGISLDSNTFCESVEARFSVYRKSKRSHYSGMKNLDGVAADAFKNAIVGGDVLVVLRFENNTVNIQLIDGHHIQTPVGEAFPKNLNGNRIIDGVEIDPTGKHVRYYVKTDIFKYSVVEAYGKKSGLQMAYLVYGLEYRLNNVRGIPLNACVLESLKKMERYKEATVGSAEERQKIAFSIEHDNTSTGENPFVKNLSKALNVDGNADLPKDLNGKALADHVAVTTNKQAINMPVGAGLKMLESKNELYFKDFYTVNIELVCASLGIPPEVAMSKYDSNFSASRAALKDWEHTLNVQRESFAFQFYYPIWIAFLETEIFKNKINAPGYAAAKASDDHMILDAYRMARFVGAPVPHIDPLKEVQAERAKLGTTGLHLPLTTLEAATESLNGGESDANMEQYSTELDYASKLKLNPVINNQAPTNNQ
ncbi:MAG: phage portal protein [Chitinophagales bacterium]